MTRRLPWGLLVLLAMFSVPAVGTRFYTFLANDVAIWALFATSLNLLVGYTGLVSFGHAAYFGVGAYTTGILMKKAGVSFLLAFPAAGLVAAAFAALFGFFCVRLTKIYFAMLTLAFAQIVWAICFKWNEVTGGEQGMPEIPYPDFGWLERLAGLLPFVLAFPAAGVLAGAAALGFGFFCVRLTRIYFAMLTLAFAQIVWAICFKWNEVTGGEQGMPEIPYPNFDWIPSLPLVGGWRTAEYFYFLTLLMVALCLWLLRRIVGSPFGRMLTAIRENPERAEFIGVNVRGYELAAFVLAGAFAGLAGGLFGIFNRGVFPDFAYWTKSSEVLIMTLLGGMGTFYGPAIGALVLILLNQQIVAYTEYWPFVLGTVLVVLLFVFPGGIAGAIGAMARRLARPRRA